MPKNLTYDNDRACCVPYDSPPPGLAAQLQRLVTEERPGACVGCGFEHNCKRDGCAAHPHRRPDPDGAYPWR